MRKLAAGFLLAILFVQVAFTQDNNPTFLKWNQINTNHFRVLFPQGYDKQAQRTASLLETIHDPVTKSMGGKSKRIPIILQNQSAVSNAFVTLAPWRSEFYGMPPQDYNLIGNNDWMNLLAVHEYRHIVQYTRANTGANRLMYWLFGQQGLAVTSFTSAPQWFWEGDAVVTETAHTNSGRGRIPEYNLLFRTNLQEGRIFNYNKQHLRSYKHAINDHYVLGYNMVAYLREKTGNPNVWEHIAARAWRTPFIPFTFSRAIRKETGMNVRQLYADMAVHLSQKWKSEVNRLELTSFEKITQRKNETYTDYLYPQVLNNGDVVAVRKGIGNVDQFVLIQEGRIKVLKTPGPVNPAGQLSVESGAIVWNEMRFDPRFQVRSYSVVMRFDIDKESTTQLSHRTRWAGAALSPDGTLIATIETTVNYESSLLIIDSRNGNVLKRIPAKAEELISMPRWIDNSSLVMLATERNQKRLIQVNTHGATRTDIAFFGDESIGHPVPFQNYVLYNSPLTGIDNVFALDRKTGERYQITNARYGAYNPCVSPDAKWIYYNDQGRDGLEIVRINFDPDSWKRVVQEYKPSSTSELLARQEERDTARLNQAYGSEFPVTHYKKWKGMLNVHSWGAYTSSSLSQLNVGVTSRDLLNTTSLEVGYALDAVERTGAWQTTLSYQALFPIIDVTVLDGNRKSQDQYSVNGDIRTINFKWKEQSVKAGVRVPLLLTHSRFALRGEVSNKINYTKVGNFTNDVDGSGRFITVGQQEGGFLDLLDNGQLLTNEFSLSLSHLHKQSRRDINSKWGQELRVTSVGALQGSDFSAATTALTGVLYFPGLFKHHSLWGIGAYQQMKVTYYPDNYWLRNKIPRPRGGFAFPIFQEFYYVSGNYTLPIWYPDLALGPFINFQRVRANMFLDYGRGSINVNNQVAKVIGSSNYLSTGVEVRFDGNLMRLLGQFDLGFRYSYQLSNQQPYFEVLIGSFGF